MELTAKEILKKNYLESIKGMESINTPHFPLAFEGAALEAMKEACIMAFEAGKEKGHWQGRLAIMNMIGCNIQGNYRTGAEMNLAKNPTKQEFINSLFPESK